MTSRALILINDEDPHVRRLARFFLEDAGFTVEIVADGEEGLARARERHPRILITEILLRRKDGLTVCRELKSDPRTRDVRILVLSILSAEERARQAGADAFLRKPLDDARLIEAVRALLDHDERRT